MRYLRDGGNSIVIIIFVVFISAFTCHDTGATVLAYAPKLQILISGGRKGYTCIIDLRLKQQQQLFQSHDSPIKAIAVDPTEEYFVTGSAEGNIKVIHHIQFHFVRQVQQYVHFSITSGNYRLSWSLKCFSLSSNFSLALLTFYYCFNFVSFYTEEAINRMIQILN